MPYEWPALGQSGQTGVHMMRPAILPWEALVEWHAFWALLPSDVTGLLGGSSQLMHLQGLAYTKCSINSGFDHFQAQLVAPLHCPSVPSFCEISSQLL